MTSGEALPVITRPTSDAVWLWASPKARKVLATRNLGAILKAYRAATGMSQRTVAKALGYDPTYISMIESGRRQISDGQTCRHFSRYLGLPNHVLGVTSSDDADFTAMLQFGASTIRLATVARQSGRAAEGINELWPLITRLEMRAATGDADFDTLALLSRARAELGVALGDLLPEERLSTAARWTGRALHLAQRLQQVDLLGYTLRVHGNELRKAGHRRAAIARLRQAAETARSPSEQATAAMQLARAAGDVGHTELFDASINTAWRCLDAGLNSPRVTPFVLHQVGLRGYLNTGRLNLAIKLLNKPAPDRHISPPQWQAIERTTVGIILLANGDKKSSERALHEAITAAAILRLPHQIQRVIRAADGRLNSTAQLGRTTLDRLQHQLRGP